MRQKIKLFFIVIFFQVSINSYAQDNRENIPSNIGFSLDVLGPIFGIYSGGLSTFMTSRTQIGIYGTYFDTRDLEPTVLGWQSLIRMNYFFSPLNLSGFYLGIFGGFESVQVKNNSNNYNSYNDCIGGIVPGYRWTMTKKINLLLGVMVEYIYESTQINPELSFIYIF